MNNQEIANIFQENKKIWREMVSGIVIKERIDIYKSLEEYLKSKEYRKAIELAFSELDINEIKNIISDIEEGKNETKDFFGKKIQIISKDDLIKRKNAFLVRRTNNLFRIEFDKELEDILEGDLERAIIDNSVVLWVTENPFEEDINVVIKYHKFYYPEQSVRGDIVLTGYDENNNYDSTKNISYENLIYILQNSLMFLGAITINFDNLNK